jgi:2-methylaconitate cis-trans-isomerase PrpF
MVGGAPGGAAPIDLVFRGFCGGRTGRLLPTDNPVDHVGGVAVTAVDAGVCAVIAEAGEFGIAGDESPRRLSGDGRLLERLESVRLRAALAMGLGDAHARVLPKVMLVSKTDRADVRSRYFVPDSCHPAHAVSGAICLATAATIPGTVVARLLAREFQAGPVVIEHPAGTLTVHMSGRGADLSAAVRSTARKLFDGYVFADVGRKAG